MKAVSLALLYLGSVSFFGLEAAKLDLASDFKRKWNEWEQQRRVRRDLPFSATALAGARAADANVLPLVRAQDVKDEPGLAQPSRPEDSHIRVKRYRPNTNTIAQFQAMRIGCRLGTCNTQNLVHKIFHLTDKDKDSTPPASKLSAHGYGRRRRSLEGARSAAALLGHGGRSRGGKSARTPPRLPRRSSGGSPSRLGLLSRRRRRSAPFARK